MPMKRLIVFSLLIFISCTHLYAQPPVTGVAFFKGTWNAAIAEAKKQQKLIFIDVYTDWCAPCKRMDAEVFPDKAVGDFYNERFINFKLDAEKGEGIELAKKFAVRSYPTWLFVDETGNVVDRGADYQPAKTFIALGKRADAQKNTSGSLAQLEERFLKGDRELAFLRQYLQKRTSMKQSNTDLLNIYVQTLEPARLKEPSEIVFLARNLGNKTSAAIPIILKHFEALQTDQKAEVARRLYDNIFYYEFGIALKEKRLNDADQLMKNIDIIAPSLTEKYRPSINNLKLHLYIEQKDATRLKIIGPVITAGLLTVNEETIQLQDRKIYDEAMAPFFSGKEDSTKIPGFAEERKRMEKQYSAGIASRLYTVAEAYFKVLPPGDKALKDALQWAERAEMLVPNPYTIKLKKDLELKVGKTP